MPQKLLGKVAVVTGAGSNAGIGKEVAKAMASEGAKVVVNDISIDSGGNKAADKVVKEINKNKGTAVASYDSVSEMSGAYNIIKTAITNFGRVDILVNTAGTFLCKPTVEHTEAEWDAILSVHLKGPFGCTKYALEEMIKQKSGGRVINITSIAGFPPDLGPGPSIAYSTAKAGILGFTKCLSLEMKEHGITVNAVSPIAVTELFPIPGKVVDGVQMFGPEYVAPIIVYLSTDEAKDITGQIIYSCSGDLIIYAPPMQVPGPHQYIHKEGKWSVDELIEIMPRMVDIKK